MRALLVLAASVAALRGAPAQSPEPLAQSAIDAAIAKGREFLHTTCAAALARGRLEANERVGQSALSLYTLLKTGAARDDGVVRELLLHIAEHPAQNTYDVACTLLALAAHDPMAHRPWVDELADQLVAWQKPAGDWAYPDAHEDLSNTQYAALGLWAASRCGYEVASDVWSRLARATLTYADADGGFGYVSSAGRGSTATGSMTAAGVGTLAMCEARLWRARNLPDELARQIGTARERGTEWLAQRFDVTTNPRSGGWHYYYLYGLERAGAFAALPRFGPHDWYDAGARFLVPEQEKSGAWNRGTDLSETCFALLFLRRATAFDDPRGPRTGVSDAAREGAFWIETEGDGPVTVTLGGWSRRDVAPLERSSERGLGPRVVAVEYWIDGALTAVEVGSPARPAGGSRFSTTLVFDTVGPRELFARAIVETPDGDRRTLESAKVGLDVLRAAPAWIAERRRAPAENLLPAAKPKAKASSTAKGEKSPFGRSWNADFAVDGNPRTPWLASESDASAQLTITLGKAVETRVLQVHAAVLAPLGSDGLSRPIKIDVSINGQERGALTMSPDPRQPMALDLQRSVSVKRIDLSITSAARSESSLCVGIGDVALFARER
jgi:hypothetical protein